LSASPAAAAARAQPVGEYAAAHRCERAAARDNEGIEGGVLLLAQGEGGTEVGSGPRTIGKACKEPARRARQQPAH
jgi:hypothetical protein